jgi:hypothetical protein
MKNIKKMIMIFCHQSVAWGNQKTSRAVILLVLLFTGMTIAAPDWSNSGGDRLWRNASNWYPNAVPTSNDHPQIYAGWSSFAGIDAWTNAVANTINMGNSSGGSHGYLVQTGGSLTVGSNFIVGSTHAWGRFDLTAGNVTTPYLDLGYNGLGTSILNVSGGNLDIAYVLDLIGGTTYFNLSGGVVETGSFAYPASAGSLFINITGNGTWISDGDKRMDFIRLKGQGILDCGASWDYDITNKGKTTVTYNQGNIRGSYAHLNKPLGHVQIAADTRHNYGRALSGIWMPVISHEIGQYSMFPDFNEIGKYTGVQKPWHLSMFQDSLARYGMADQSNDFFRASGALAVLCYREDIEAALRTAGLDGFQIMDLQDFQYGPAIIGILDSFMDSKGLIDANEWRQFCSETVPLLQFEKYTWKKNETFTADFLCSHYGPNVLTSVTPIWELRDCNDTVVASGSLNVQDVNIGLNYLGNVNINLSSLVAPQKFTLITEIYDTNYKNVYPIWVYPSSIDTTSSTIEICNAWDENTISMLNDGDSVLLIPTEPNELFSIPGFWPTNFCTWQTFNYDAPGTLGILCDPNHSLFNYFPTEFHSNWQWFRLINNSRSFMLHQTPLSYRPIVQVIDNFERNHKLGLIFECNVSNGKLLICGINLQAMTGTAESDQLLYSIIQYMESDDFLPSNTFTTVLVGDIINGPEKKMLAHWTFDSVDGGKFTDSSGEGHDATINGTAVLCTGKYGNAADFQNGNFYATAGSWDPSEKTRQFSISFWIKYCGETGTIVSKDSDNIEGITADQWRVLVSNAGEIYFDDPNTYLWYPKTAPNVLVNDGNWHKVCLIETGISRQIYVDDIKALDVDGSFNGIYPDAEIHIGSMCAGYWNASNKIDDMKIYNYNIME